MLTGIQPPPKVLQSGPAELIECNAYTTTKVQAGQAQFFCELRFHMCGVRSWHAVYAALKCLQYMTPTPERERIVNSLMHHCNPAHLQWHPHAVPCAGRCDMAQSTTCSICPQSLHTSDLLCLECCLSCCCWACGSIQKPALAAVFWHVQMLVLVLMCRSCCEPSRQASASA